MNSRILLRISIVRPAILQGQSALASNTHSPEQRDVQSGIAIASGATFSPMFLRSDRPASPCIHTGGGAAGALHELCSNTAGPQVLRKMLAELIFANDSRNRAGSHWVGGLSCSIVLR